MEELVIYSHTFPPCKPRNLKTSTMEKTHQTSDQREAYIQRATKDKVYSGNINSLKNYWKFLAMDKQKKFKFKVK